MRRFGLVALVAALAGATACGPSIPKGPSAPTAAVAGTPVNPVAVSASEFAPRTAEVLAKGTFEQRRLDLLAGVVQRQLRRASDRFEAGQTEAGLAALTGALYLLRAGEFRTEMLAGGTPALQAGVAEVARSGNEGRAFALYAMLRSVLPPGHARDDVDAHLEALRRWTASTLNTGPMQAASAAQQMAVDRSLFEATLPALNAARDATVAWLKRAVSSGAVDQPITSNFEREEAISAYRAINSGGIAFVGLHLRHGDAVGAFTAVAGSDLGRIIPPVLMQPLERAAMDNDPAAWAELFSLYRAAQDSTHPQLAIDPELARAAAWGAALELYRTNPGNLDHAKPLASLLPEFEMPEVASVVLAGALGRQPSAADLSFCLALLLHAMIEQDSIGQLAEARRTFAAAAPILAAAERKAVAGQVHPDGLRMRYVMGALETRAGDLERARPLIEAVVAAQTDLSAPAAPTLDALRLLASIERGQGRLDAALQTLGRVIQLAHKLRDPLEATEGYLSAFEIHRDRGDAQQAQTALATALAEVLAARSLVRNTPGQAHAERLLARVLEHYGEVASARRATERAYDASRSDSQQLAATVLDASRRGLTHGDLLVAREAVRRAVEAGLPDEDVVYVALWLQLLERRLKRPADGTVEGALSAMQSGHGWPGRLRAWARGMLSDEGLLKAAHDRVERTEAVFYTAMAKHAGQGGNAGLEGLREVASSPTIELVEVTIARDLLAERDGKLELALPDDVKLP